MAGYSPNPLAKKLGLKAGHAVAVAGAPDDYPALIGAIARDLSLGRRVSAATDVVHVFTTRRAELERRLADLRAQLKPTAVVWISWPKKTSGVATDVTETIVRETGLAAGLVDVKICAVDETWSGLKFVYRLSDR